MEATDWGFSGLSLRSLRQGIGRVSGRVSEWTSGWVGGWMSLCDAAVSSSVSVSSKMSCLDSVRMDGWITRSRVPPMYFCRRAHSLARDARTSASLDLSFSLALWSRGTRKYSCDVRLYRKISIPPRLLGGTAGSRESMLHLQYDRFCRLSRRLDETFVGGLCLNNGDELAGSA